MILSRGLYNASPPERRTRIANNPTLLYSWWCTIFSLGIILVRLSGRYIRNNQLFREDKIMAWSIIPLMARMGFAHVVLLYGTNNVDASALTDPTKIHHREVGARMVLAARVFYAMLYVRPVAPLKPTLTHPQHLDGQVYRFRILKALDTTLLEARLRVGLAWDSHLSCSHLRCRAHLYLCRVSAFYPLLAGSPGPRATMPTRLRTTAHYGRC
jgi:hypothetical protein